MTVQRNDVSAREVLDAIAGGALRAQLVDELRRRFPGRSREQIDEAFREAYTRGLTDCRWRREHEVYGWLRRVMERLLVDELRRERRELVVDSRGAVFEQADTGAEPLGVLARREDREEVAEVHGAVARLLSERQRRVMDLRAEGAERREIARRVGASEKAIKTDVARLYDVARDQLAARSGHGCAEGERLVARYAFGLGSRADWLDAQLHLASCEPCGGFFERLVAWREKVAALLPVAGVEQASPGAFERGVQQLLDALASVKQQLAEAGAHAKQQASAGYYRAVDLTPLSGARPGAAAAVIGGCLALGGGGAYCLDQGVSPLAVLPDPPAETRPAEPTPTTKPAAADPPSAPEPPVAVAPTPPPAPAEQPAQAAPAPEPPPPPPPPEPTPAPVEFGEPASATAGSPARPSPAQPARPAPAAQGGSEFEP
jgi:RNA polymerase sigma factor (sigma-70 family)